PWNESSGAERDKIMAEPKRIYGIAVRRDDLKARSSGVVSAALQGCGYRPQKRPIPRFRRPEVTAGGAIAPMGGRRHSWWHANPAAWRGNSRPVFGSDDSNGGGAFGCSEGQSRTGQASFATAPFLAHGPGWSVEAVGRRRSRCAACSCHHRGG